MNEIIPGIFRMPIPIRNNPLGATNTYLIKGNDGYLLIDAGWNSPDAFESMEHQLAEAGLTFTDIRKILVTHVHPDHYGLVPAVRERSGAEIMLHRIEKDLLLNRYSAINDALFDIETVFRKNGAPSDEIPMFRLPGKYKKSFSAPLVPDTALEDGDVLQVGEFTLLVILTPGHSPGHICLYEKNNKLLFGGDHVLPGITPNISLMPFGGENPLGDFMRSMNTLEKLEVSLVLPAHEEPYPDLQKRIREITAHHKQRNREITRGLDGQPLTAYQISGTVTWMPAQGGVKYADLSPVDKRMAMMETLAHLRAMTEDGELSCFEENGTVYFRTA
jgi:glyoxylase-like metal-dependent hydrolase (beta-lactamase superfamily II)